MKDKVVDYRITSIKRRGRLLNFLTSRGRLLEGAFERGRRLLHFVKNHRKENTFFE